MENTEEALPMVAMIVVTFAQIGLITLSKVAMISGLNPFVLMVYYDALGTIILLPWYLCRCLSGNRLPITFSLLCRIFGLSLIGKCLFPICYFCALSYSSITVAAAIENLSPIFTSLLAFSFRMERLDLWKLSDQIKALGTIVSVLGALIVTLYKGPVLLAAQVSSNSAPHTLLLSEQSNWLLGCLLFMLAFLIRSLWNILQADTAKSYPDEVALVFFYILFGTIQNAAASLLFLVKGQSSWKLHHKIDIITVLYAAFFTTAFTTTVDTWCLRKKGAIYVSMFSPLKVAIAGVMGFAFLQDGVYLGSVIGSATIVVGFYAVMWAQAKNKSKLVNKIGGLESVSSSQVTPLLQSSLS